MYRELKLSGAFRARFPLPESKGERGQAILLLGLAILIGAGFDPTVDLIAKLRGISADAALVKTAQYREQGSKRLVGIYMFSDAEGNNYPVQSRIIYKARNQIPQKAQVVWNRGEPQKAKILGNYKGRIWVILAGLAISVLGILAMRKKPEVKQEI